MLTCVLQVEYDGWDGDKRWVLVSEMHHEHVDDACCQRETLKSISNDGVWTLWRYDKVSIYTNLKKRDANFNKFF